MKTKQRKKKIKSFCLCTSNLATQFGHFKRKFDCLLLAFLLLQARVYRTTVLCCSWRINWLKTDFSIRNSKNNNKLLMEYALARFNRWTKLLTLLMTTTNATDKKSIHHGGKPLLLLDVLSSHIVFIVFGLSTPTFQPITVVTFLQWQYFYRLWIVHFDKLIWNSHNLFLQQLSSTFNCLDSKVRHHLKSL